jgi:L-rhamnose-H+ transport protein
VHLGEYKFTSWAIHMIMLVLFSNLVGLALREWRACRRVTDVTIVFALVVLTAAVLALTYGNKKGEEAAQAAARAAAAAQTTETSP